MFKFIIIPNPNKVYATKYVKEPTPIDKELVHLRQFAEQLKKSPGEWFVANGVYVSEDNKEESVKEFKKLLYRCLDPGLFMMYKVKLGPIRAKCCYSFLCRGKKNEFTRNH